MSDESPLQFPCEFPIKVMGAAGHDLENLVAGLVRQHAPELTDDAVTSRSSRHGNYLSVTVTIDAQSRAQLDAIYRDLTARDEILAVF